MRSNASSPLIASQPQYVLVAQALIQDIGRGHFPVGSLLPPELDLCKQFGVSRHTIREAIRRLQERGLVTRQRGVGTSVKANPAHSRYVQSTAAISDLPQYVEDTRLVTSDAADVIADAELASLLKCPEGQRWVRVTGFRYAGKDKLPMAFTQVYINAAYGGIRKLVGTLKVPVYTLIEREYGVTIVEVKQEIRATTISAADAKLLSVKPRSAGLVVIRHYFADNNRLLEVGVNLHPAERFSYSMSLRLQAPPVAGTDLERHL